MSFVMSIIHCGLPLASTFPGSPRPLLKVVFSVILRKAVNFSIALMYQTVVGSNSSGSSLDKT